MRLPGGSPRRLPVAVAGGVSAVGYGAAAFALPAISGAAAYAFVALFLALGGVYLAVVAMLPRWEPSFRHVLFWAVAFRLLLLPAGLPSGAGLGAIARDVSSRGVGYERFLLYDHDVWRYLWDGHVATYGLSPYGATPAELEERAIASGPESALFVEPPWEDLFENLPFQDHLTVYPPAAQLLFRAAHALAPGSVLTWKLLLIVLDLAATVALARVLKRLGRSPGEVLVYAWNPLLVKEVAGSAHVDALAIALLAAALLAWPRRPGTALAAVTAAAAAKLAPALVLPLFLRGASPARWLAVPATAVVLVLPFRHEIDGLLSGLQAFGAAWVFNAGAWQLLRGLAAAAGAAHPEQLATLAAATIPVALALALAVSRPRGVVDLAARVYLVLAVTVLVAPAVMPWYALWALPAAVVAGSRAWPAVTVLLFLSYRVYVDETEPAAWLLVEHLACWALLLYEAPGLLRRARLASA